MSRAAEHTHLFRQLKAPAAARALPKLADRARAEEWSYERFAEALLATEQSSREAHGGEARIRAARFPARKTLEEFDFSFQRSVKKQVIEHLGQLDFLHAYANRCLGIYASVERAGMIAVGDELRVRRPEPPPRMGVLAGASATTLKRAALRAANALMPGE